MYGSFKALVAAIAVLWVSPSAFAETITIIDDFSDGSSELAAFGLQSDEDTGLLSAIGGVRKVHFDGDGGRGWVNSAPYLGQAHMRKGFFVSLMTLSYGSKTAAGSELNLNWSSGGSIFVSVSEVESSSAGREYFSLLPTIESGGTDYAQWYLGLTDGTMEIPLSDFPDLNLSEVDGLEFLFFVESPNGVLYHYLTIDAIYTDAVPEPSTLLLLGVGALCRLASIGQQRRRRH